MLSRALADRAAILDAVSHHPFARFIAGMSSDLHGVAVNGYSAGPAVLWWGDSPLGRLGHGIGDPPASTPRWRTLGTRAWPTA